jgi:hypothetical protein
LAGGSFVLLLHEHVGGGGSSEIKKINGAVNNNQLEILGSKRQLMYQQLFRM